MLLKYFYKSLIVAVLFIVGTVPTVCTAKYLHEGFTQPGKHAVLHGTTLATSNDSASPSLTTQDSEVTYHLVDFYIHLDRDVILWDELHQDGVALQCDASRLPSPGFPTPSGRPEKDIDIQRNTARPLLLGQYAFTFRGSVIESSDFSTGTVFVIDNYNFERVCGKVVDAVPGVSEEDDTLFFEIFSVPSSGSTHVTVHARRVSGAEVAPLVDVSVHQNSVPETALPKQVVYEEDSLSVASRDLFAEEAWANDTIPHQARLTFSCDRYVSLGTFGTLDLHGSVSADVTRFRLSRVSGLQFTWEQRLSASLTGTL